MTDISVTNESIPGTYSKKKDFKSLFHKTVETKVLTTFLVLVFILCNFIFNTKFYLQFKVCALGTICAPFYANIFMAYFEQKFTYLTLAGET